MVNARFLLVRNVVPQVLQIMKVHRLRKITFHQGALVLQIGQKAMITP
jgi:hypothetical protein